MLSDVSNAIVRLHAENYGRGPTRARADMARDLLIVVLEDSLTPVERTLMDRGRGQQVLDLRREFQAAMGGDYIEVVQAITGRRVRAFLSEVNLEPDIAVELFFLDPPQDGEV
jgi:uncharacterized protein YbcI